MKIISWKCLCPPANGTDGCSLWPQIQELNCSQLDTLIPFVFSVRFRHCSHSGIIFDGEIAKGIFRELSTNISMTHSLRGLCCNWALMTDSSATYTTPDPSVCLGFSLRPSQTTEGGRNISSESGRNILILSLWMACPVFTSMNLNGNIERV